MGCLSGKELQGKQLAVKHRFKQAVAPGHLARLTLQKDTRVEHGSQISKMVSCCAPAPAPALRCSRRLRREGSREGDPGNKGASCGRRRCPDGGGQEMAGL